MANESTFRLSIKTKRPFNLLVGVNQGSGLLLARGLEKREPVALVNTTEKIECSLTFLLLRFQRAFSISFHASKVKPRVLQFGLMETRVEKRIGSFCSEINFSLKWKWAKLVGGESTVRVNSLKKSIYFIFHFLPHGITHIGMSWWCDQNYNQDKDQDQD